MAKKKKSGKRCWFCKEKGWNGRATQIRYAYRVCNYHANKIDEKSDASLMDALFSMD